MLYDLLPKEAELHNTVLAVGVATKLSYQLYILTYVYLQITFLSDTYSMCICRCLRIYVNGDCNRVFVLSIYIAYFLNIIE